MMKSHYNNQELGLLLDKDPKDHFCDLNYPAPCLGPVNPPW